MTAGAPDLLRTAAVQSARRLHAPLPAEFDVVVVGSGAGGAMLARDASAAGLRVLVLEEGGHHGPADFTQREGDMLPRLFFDGGGRTTDDGGVAILHGRCVGGGTVHNTNLCKRAPDAVLRRWVAEHGAAAEGGRAKWSYHSVSFRDTGESFNHYTNGNWGGIVSKMRADMAANAQ